jgi:hypothetical protein
MALGQLLVLNRNVGTAPAATLPPACAVTTCLREVRVSMCPADDATIAAARAGGFDPHVGVAGYQFLLQLACGLESEIAGETEIFGQIKQAWRDHETGGGDHVKSLRPWMQRLLQDTKEIRSEHVVGLGSATYGSLVRRLLGGVTQGPTLLVGAGQLSEAILPFLDSGEALVWNRSRARAETLLSRQRATASSGRIQLLEATTAAEDAAWQRAQDVILCIPADAARDPERVKLWQRRGTPARRILHLGIDGADGTAWQGAHNLLTLRDLFALRDSQAVQRDALLARARKACADKAQLARLDDADGSRVGNASHGWEDLAVFQAFGY